MVKKTTIIIALGIALILLKLVTIVGMAQADSQVYLTLDKVIGYKSGFWVSQLEAQGTLAVNAEAPAGVTRVAFYIDGSTLMGEDTQAPFSLQFYSDSYVLGMHTLTARGFTAEGKEIGSNTISVKFVTTAESVNAGLLIAVPLAIVVILFSSITWYATRAKKLASLPAGAPRVYGSAGGAICGRCGRPFAMHNLSLNLVSLKLERCPYCGRLAFVRRRSEAELHRAEAAELETAGSAAKTSTPDPSEKLRRDIDASRYQND